MSETTTPSAGESGAPSGEGAPAPVPATLPVPAAPVDSGADAFAQERARLEASARDWQAKYDRLAAQTAPAPAPADPAPAPSEQTFLTRDDFRAELRRQREIDSAVDSLREQFPNATRTLSNPDSFESVEAMRVAAESEQSAFASQVGPAVEAAVQAALAPYVAKFGPIQTAPAGAQPGQGQGLPTLQDIDRMNLDELDEVEKAHPGLIGRLHREALTR